MERFLVACCRGRGVLIAQNRFIKGTKGNDKFPVDYQKQFSDEQSQEKARQERVLQLKNVVMRIVIAIRERKNRPKLTEVMKVYKKKIAEAN